MTTYETCARVCRANMRRFARVWVDQRALKRDSRFSREALKLAIEMRDRAKMYETLRGAWE